MSKVIKETLRLLEQGRLTGEEAEKIILEQRLETASAVDTIVSSAEWISVEDRLPKKSGFYLISNGVFVKRGEYNIRYEKWFAPTEVSGVTHWARLPEPPNV